MHGRDVKCLLVSMSLVSAAAEQVDTACLPGVCIMFELLCTIPPFPDWFQTVDDPLLDPVVSQNA